VRINFSGSGVGPDPLAFTEDRAFFANTPSRELDDAERVRAWIEAGVVPWLDPRRGALLGHSLGGAVALIHAARHPEYRAVVAWARRAWRSHGATHRRSRVRRAPTADAGAAQRRLRVGGRRQLVVPPRLGYGSRATGPVPPNAVLVFTIELVGVR
jgi:pimeloyl-ACP methyl ester carboxylesterase